MDIPQKIDEILAARKQQLPQIAAAEGWQMWFLPIF